MSSRTPRKRSIEDPKLENGSPYRLRENSKLPSRYRNDGEPESPLRRTPKSSNAKNSPKYAPAKQGRFTASPKKSSKEPEEQPTSSIRRFPIQMPHRAARRTLALDGIPPQPQEVRSTPESAINDFESIFDPDMFDSEESRDLMLSKMSRYKSRNDIGKIMRTNLKRLKNMLTLPKARQFVVCEFFYSGVDEQLFLSENEFQRLVQDSFPALQAQEMTLTEWRVVRRQLGKPRRCSQTFLDEERECLEQRRKKVRGIYAGSYLHDPNFDITDLPNKLPKPLIVGMRVYARIRTPKDGIYAGSIDAVLPGAYRIIFEKKELPPAVVIDTEVMLDGRQELIDIAYFVEEVNARLPTGMRPVLKTIKGPEEKPTVVRNDSHPLMLPDYTQSGLMDEGTENFFASEVDRVGNFPLRFLVLLTKTLKLVNNKKKLVKQLASLNSEAEKIHLSPFGYTKMFRKRYAEVVGEIDVVSQLLQLYLKAVQAYNPQLFAASPDAHKPETVVRMCNLQAARFVQNCNNGLDVENPKALNLITGLTSLLLQVRAIGHKMSAVDLQSLQESIIKVKNQVSPENAEYFEDFVEVHMRYLHNLMIDSAKAVSAKRRSVQKGAKQE